MASRDARHASVSLAAGVKGVAKGAIVATSKDATGKTAIVVRSTPASTTESSSGKPAKQSHVVTIVAQPDSGSRAKSTGQGSVQPTRVAAYSPSSTQAASAFMSTGAKPIVVVSTGSAPAAASAPDRTPSVSSVFLLYCCY